MIPTLTTERMTLGPFTHAHFEAFAAFCKTDRSRFLGGPTTDPRDAWDSCMIHLGQWHARGYGGLFATETATGKPCGRLSIWHPVSINEPELSWVMFDGFEGTGLAAEGAIAVRNWAASQGLPALASYIASDNTRSIALAKRLGCTPDGTHSYRPGDVVDIWRHPMGTAA